MRIYFEYNSKGPFNVAHLEGLIFWIIFPVVPPQVEYKLSYRGRSLETILRGLDRWGMEDSTLTAKEQAY